MRFDRERLRFLGALAAYAVVTWIVFRDAVMGPVLVPLRNWTAEVALTAVHAAGMDAVRAGSVLSHPGGFAYEISRGCTGLVGAGLLTVAILAFPASRWKKRLGVACCVSAFLAVNVIRLVHLFYLGVHQPAVFHVYHEIVWQTAMAVAVFGLWCGWMMWAVPTPRAARVARAGNRRVLELRDAGL